MLASATRRPVRCGESTYLDYSAAAEINLFRPKTIPATLAFLGYDFDVQ
jgi:hypothetical protein